MVEKEIFGEYGKNQRVDIEDPKYVNLEATYRMKEVALQMELNDNKRDKIVNSPHNLMGLMASGLFTVVPYAAFGYGIYEDGIAKVAHNVKETIFSHTIVTPVIAATLIAPPLLTRYFYKRFKKDNEDLKTLNDEYNNLKTEKQELEMILKKSG